MAVATISEEVAALARLDLDGLRAEWKRHAGAPTKLRSEELLRLMLAWKIQAQALGGLDPETRRQLRRKGRAQAEGIDLGIGARIRREWQGGTVEVEVVDGGFRWDGRMFKSLSAAATAITGVKWNGPRFFGLREKAA